MNMQAGYIGPAPDDAVDEATAHSVIDATTGEVIQTGVAVGTPPLDDNQLVVPQLAPPHTYYDFDLEGFVSKGTPPNSVSVFDYALKQWVDARSLEQLRAAKWIEIKRAREAVEYSEFVVPGLGSFDSDAASQGKIVGAALAASVDPAGFGLHWTGADNSLIWLDAAGAMAMAQGLTAHINAAHAIGRELRNAIETATTPDELAAISWPT